MTKTRTWFFMVLVSVGLAILLLPIPAIAQSNSVIDAVLSQKQASFGDSVYLVLSAGDLISSTSDVNQALSVLRQKRWVNVPADPDKAITFGEYAYVLMKTFDIPGGVMYNLFPGPRYAGREVVYRGWTTGNLSPYETLSGRQVLYILRSYLDSRGKS